jgi:ABC-2 type transport system permease protein
VSFARAARLTWEQIRYQNRVFWRNPLSAGFTLVMPLMFLVLFNVIFAQGPTGADFIQTFTPAIAVFGAVSATFTNLAIGTGLVRSQGILKRVRGTPLPPAIYIAGRIGSAVWVAIVSVVIMLTTGVVLYGFRVPWGNLPVAVLTFVAGVGCFAALGLAVSAVVARGDAIPAVANAIILPLAFISGVFVPVQQLPKWLSDVGAVFPLRHFVTLFGRALDPSVTGSALDWRSMAIMLLWGGIATVVAVRWFRWESGTEGRRTARQPA